jgi:hypothetical protein
MPKLTRCANTWSAFLLLASLDCSGANAQSENDLSGKTVTLLSSAAPGGGYDLYGRLFASHLSAHLPGKPTVIVRNMPGAGGLVGTNFLYNVAPKDGTMIGIVPQTVAIAHVFGGPSVLFDPTKFNWLGRINSNVEVEQTWFTAAVKTIADAKVHDVTVAGTGPDSSSAVFPRILDGMFGMKFKVVSGYESATMATFAMERSEVEGVVRPWAVTKAIHPEWLRDKKSICWCNTRSNAIPNSRTFPRWSIWPRTIRSGRFSRFTRAAARSAARSWRRPGFPRRWSRRCGRRLMRP